MTTIEIYTKLLDACVAYLNGDGNGNHLSYDDIVSIVEEVLDQMPDCVGARYLFDWLHADFFGPRSKAAAQDLKIGNLYAFAIGVGYQEL